MKTVTSSERSTGMGARHYTAVLLDGKWLRLSKHPDVVYTGRDNGFENYLIDVADDAITAIFHRSNSGRETVDASNGMQWESFQMAARWAASGTSAPTTCPHCGREM